MKLAFWVGTDDVLPSWYVMYELLSEHGTGAGPHCIITLGPSDSQQSAISCIATSSLFWHGSSENTISCGENLIMIILFSELDLSV